MAENQYLMNKTSKQMFLIMSAKSNSKKQENNPVQGRHGKVGLATFLFIHHTGL